MVNDSCHGSQCGREVGCFEEKASFPTDNIAPISQKIKPQTVANVHGETNSEDGDKSHEMKNPISRLLNYVIPYGGILSGALNFASQTLGAGIMAIPSAFTSAGWIMAIFYLLFFTAITVFSIYLLAKVSEKTGLRSFEVLARGIFGRRGDIFAATILILLNFGGATGFIVGVGDICQVLLQHDGVPSFLHGENGRYFMQVAVWVFLMLPVTLPKYINSLRYISAVGVFSVIFFVCCVVGYSAAYINQNGFRKDIVKVTTGNIAASALPIFIFAFLCHSNSFKIYYEMTNRTVPRMVLSATLNCSICCTMYFFVGFFGCAWIGNVKDNIMLHIDPWAEPVFLVCFGGFTAKLVASFSQNMMSCRTAVFQVMSWDLDTMPFWKHTLVAGSFALGVLILGLFVPSLTMAFGLAGSLCGAFTGFIFPSLFIMYAGNWSLKAVGLVEYLLTYLLLICGVVAMVFGTTSTIKEAMVRYG